ncbi:MAG TPA: hypothetical protein VJ845_00060 [Haploplasma sp.]|nr:hypothetical protein [Haploplasma sp.]
MAIASLISNVSSSTTSTTFISIASSYVPNSSVALIVIVAVPTPIILILSFP